MNHAANIAHKLLQINAIKLSPQKPFTWASGLKSPIYCDNRMVLSHPAIRTQVIDAFIELSSRFQAFDTVAGVATAGIAHGALIAQRLQLPFIYVRSKAKAHGRQNLIEGQLAPNASVLVIEDLISTGGSALKAVEALQAEGAQVAAVLAIFSYQLPAAEQAFAEATCSYATISNYETLLEEAIKDNYISKSDQESLQAWRQSPKEWSDQQA